MIGKATVTTLWGYLAKNNNPGNVKIVSDYASYCKLVMDCRKDVFDAYLLNDKQLAVFYRDSVEQPDRHGNVVLGRAKGVPRMCSGTIKVYLLISGAFTTSQARLRLYSCLETLQDRAIYMDTDSVSYLSFKTQIVAKHAVN